MEAASSERFQSKHNINEDVAAPLFALIMPLIVGVIIQFMPAESRNWTAFQEKEKLN